MDTRVDRGFSKSTKHTQPILLQIDLGGSWQTSAMANLYRESWRGESVVEDVNGWRMEEKVYRESETRPRTRISLYSKETHIMDDCI
jgi:hypothetical protein